LTTLRIEHAISDYDVWRAAFDRFSDARARAGVLEFVIRLPVDDPLYLMLDLEFESRASAERFATFLETQVWTSAEASPGLAGAPRVRILDVVPVVLDDSPGGIASA
jgi:hypothetical protein